MKLYVEILASEFETRAPENDGWDQGDSGADYRGCEVRLHGWSDYISSHSRPVEVEFSVLPDDEVYVLIVKYRTGSTFGSEERFAVVDVFNNPDDAFNLEKVIRKNNEYTFKFKGKEYYASWIGYFESLLDTRVEKIRVKGRTLRRSDKQSRL